MTTAYLLGPGVVKEVEGQADAFQFPASAAVRLFGS